MSDLSPGTIHKMNTGELVIIDNRGHKDIDIMFTKTGYKATVSAARIRNRTVKDRLHRSLCGVGYMGDGEYVAYVNGKATTAYSVWSSMINRCYNKKVQNNHPTYHGCSVCDEWQSFSNFYSWFNENYIDGFDLDKDIKVDGNRIYSPEFCCFVSRFDNTQKSSAKTRVLVSPSGGEVSVYNVNKFCRDNGLHRSCITRVLSGKQMKHKGWTIPVKY